MMNASLWCECCNVECVHERLHVGRPFYFCDDDEKFKRILVSTNSKNTGDHFQLRKPDFFKT